MQSRNPEGYFWNSTSQAYFQSQIWSRFSFQIPNPELLIGEIPSPEKPIDDPLSRQIISLTWTLCASYTTVFVSVGLTLLYILPYPTPPPFFFQTHRVVKPDLGWWLTARISNGSNSQWWVPSHLPHWSSSLFKLGNVTGEWLLRTQMPPSLAARGTDLS